MEISAEKTQLTTDNTSGINTEIKVNIQKLETVTSFTYLASFITNSLQARNTVQDSTGNSSIDIISLSSKIRLMRSLVTSIFLYACESWTLTAELKEEYKPWK